MADFSNDDNPLLKSVSAWKPVVFSHQEGKVGYVGFNEVRSAKDLLQNARNSLMLPSWLNSDPNSAMNSIVQQKSSAVLKELKIEEVEVLKRKHHPFGMQSGPDPFGGMPGNGSCPLIDPGRPPTYC